jgi:predicted butyrate kinase (DUF1464 family)
MVLEVTPFSTHFIITFILKNYTTILRLINLATVIELAGVNNKFTVPVVIDASNVPNDKPVNTSPYCTNETVVPSCTINNSII